MGISRVTQSSLIARVLSNITRQQKGLLDLQDQLSTGLRVSRPSDDPLAARRAVDARMEVAKLEQYLTNISTVQPMLNETETALRSAVNVVQRAKELALQGANDTNSALQRTEIAEEVNQLIESILNEANHTTNGRYIFAGTRTTAEPFVATRDASGEVTAVTYIGSDEDIEVEISEGILLPINVTGEEAFMSTSATSVDIMDVLIQLRDDLRADDTAAISSHLDDLDTAQDQLLISVAETGATTNRLIRTDETIRTVLTQLEQLISDNIDADYAEVIVNLNAQSNAFQSSLNAASRVIQPTLLDFLR